MTTITNPRPRIVPSPQTVTAIVGKSVNITGTQTIFDVDGQPQVIEHSPGYFTFFSSDENVVSVNPGQLLLAVDILGILRAVTLGRGGRQVPGDIGTAQPQALQLGL